ncbi:MAG: thiamine biosynthesis protein ThiS [Syntrophus sp. RIFOXYC2_FULL_54_9]|nr:MAG: thiamine biosynthesis protein ThiS [Syntrophus sp. GWC2_56_31]OHE27542.1 MAG: thiamine biosynthesis protein ThiS [Syntrophus sp. RIFOXYC2_FULL_54_9]
MILNVNGKKAVIADKESLTISGLLDVLNVSDPLYVTVELNGDILKRANFDGTFVRDGDEMEFLYFMGGGRG